MRHIDITKCDDYGINQETFEDSPVETVPKDLAIRTSNANTDIPARFSDATFLDYPESVGEEREYCLRNDDHVFLFCGTVGTGKTRRLVCAIHERALHGLAAGAFLSAKMLCAKIRTSRSFSAKMNEEELLKFYSTVPFLCIDEMGKEEDQVSAWNFYNVVLSQRYDNKLPTWIATNMTSKATGDFLKGENNKGMDVYDRISSVLKIKVMTGESFRKAG